MKPESEPATQPATQPAAMPTPPAPQPAPALARLLAKLLNPAPAARILDPHCGTGEILLAVHQAHPQDAEQHLNLYGQDPEAANLAIAADTLQAHGATECVLLPVDALKNPLLDASTHQLLRFDHVISWVPANQGTWFQSWTKRDRFRRFPSGPPEARALARIWHNLGCLNQTGSMVLLLPASVLATTDSYPLRQYLVNNWLDAVITAPPTLWPDTPEPLQILVCQHHSSRKRNHIAFICADGPNPATASDAIHAAYWAHRTGHAHPCLQHCTHALLTSTRYSLNQADYPPGSAPAGLPTPAHGQKRQHLAL